MGLLSSRSIDFHTAAASGCSSLTLFQLNTTLRDDYVSPLSILDVADLVYQFEDFSN